MSVAGKCYYRLGATRWGHQLARSAVSSMRRLGALREFRMPLDSLSLPYPAVRSLMSLWRRKHWSSGDGMMPPPELLAMFKLAYLCPVDGDFVELGSWRGLTTSYLATACRARGRGHVFAVDTFAGTREHNTRYKSVETSGTGTFDDFKRNINKASVADLVTPYIGYTTEMAARHKDRKIALLFIDADHSYGGVKADFETWFPMVTTGGIVAFHDYAMVDGDVHDYVNREIKPRTDLIAVPGAIVPNIFAVTRRALTADRR